VGSLAGLLPPPSSPTRRPPLASPARTSSTLHPAEIADHLGCVYSTISRRNRTSVPCAPAEFRGHNTEPQADRASIQYLCPRNPSYRPSRPAQPLGRLRRNAANDNVEVAYLPPGTVWSSAGTPLGFRTNSTAGGVRSCFLTSGGLPLLCATACPPGITHSSSSATHNRRSRPPRRPLLTHQPAGAGR